MNRVKRPGYEVVIVVIVVVLSVVIGGGLYAGRAKMHKAALLTRELSMLRSSITLYRLVNGAYPAELKNLVTETYEAGDVKRPYLEGLPGVAKGEIADPFGKSYQYNAATGWVQSPEKGYERW